MKKKAAVTEASANTARRPNIHWYMKDLQRSGFVQRLREHGSADAILGLHVPVEHLQAWCRLATERVSPEELEKLRAEMKAHPVELTIRMNDAERTLHGTYNESHTCPPSCT